MSKFKCSCGRSIGAGELECIVCKKASDLSMCEKCGKPLGRFTLPTGLEKVVKLDAPSMDTSKEVATVILKRHLICMSCLLEYAVLTDNWFNDPITEIKDIKVKIELPKGVDK